MRLYFLNIWWLCLTTVMSLWSKSYRDCHRSLEAMPMLAYWSVFELHADISVWGWQLLICTWAFCRVLHFISCLLSIYFHGNTGNFLPWHVAPDHPMLSVAASGLDPRGPAGYELHAGQSPAMSLLQPAVQAAGESWPPSGAQTQCTATRS